MKTIDELDRLHAAATAGEWRRSLAGRIIADGWPVVIADGPNAAAIVALHNAWPTCKTGRTARSATRPANVHTARGYRRGSPASSCSVGG